MADNNQDFIQVLLEKIEKDDLPTNVFDVEGTDPLVLLGKMNEIIGQLENFQSSVNTSNSTANEALSKANDAVDTSGQALSNANTALGTANQAIGTANTAIETANQSLETAQEAEDIAETANQNSNQAVTTANEAKSKAENALEQVTQGLGTKVYDNSGNLLNETTFTGSNGINVDMDATSHKNFVISIDQSVADKISQNETDISELQSASTAQDQIIAQIEDDVDNLDNIVKAKVQEITLTGSTGGTITAEQLTTLQADDSNYIILNDEIYRLADKQDASGYRVYTHTGQDNSNFFTKSLTITLSTLAWTLTSRTILDVESNQRITGLKTFENSIILYFNDNITSQISIMSSGSLLLNNIRAKGVSLFENMPQVDNYGKIVDSGSNANGYYVRIADGTQICYNVLTYSSTGNQTITLPLPFKDTNYVVSWSYQDTESSNQLSFRVMAATNKTTSTFINRFVSNVGYIYIAIGKWK